MNYFTLNLYFLKIIFIFFCFVGWSRLISADGLTESVIESIFENTVSQSFETACREDIVSLCGESNGHLSSRFKGVFGTLSCISSHYEKEDQLSPHCQNEIWAFKYNITNARRFEEVTETVCKSLLLTNRDCLEARYENDINPGAMILSCLIDRTQPDVDRNCGIYLHSMEMLIFGDYRLIHKFASVCEAHIKEFKCGRLTSLHENVQDMHSQASTVDCLQDHLDKLPEDCLHEILRISELQSDDFHLDKPLYFACRDDRETYCKHVEAGQGRVYRCLMKNNHQSEMSEACKNKLTQRERLITQDYRVSKSLVHACKADIKRYQCRENTSSHKEIRLSQILLCLENAQSKDLPILTDCQSELLIHRRNLINDYKLSPTLIDACQYDIAEFCSAVQDGAKILHCLMKFAKPKRRRGDDHHKKRVSPKCNREIELLLKEVNVAEDWRVDIVFQEACQSSVNDLCTGIKPGHGRILACLAEHVGSSRMREECRQELYQMQYFFVRNFEIDTQLYQTCHTDAVRYCHAKRDWADDPNKMDPERGPTVMACLYRYVYHPDKRVGLQKQCVDNVKRVMMQRASSVDLLPFIEEPCMQDLAIFCSQDESSVTKKGFEMECLQGHYAKLSANCRNAIGNFTQDQSLHFELNYPLLRSCSQLAQQVCPQQYDNFMYDNQGKIIECLVLNKNNYQMKQNEQCLKAIEAFQIISNSDFRFNAKFREACKADVATNCNQVQTKYDVVNCLGMLAYSDDDAQQTKITNQCKKALRSELFLLNEDIALDPSLAEACQTDRKVYCKNVEEGEANVIECLTTNILKLRRSCQRHLFHKEHIELSDSSVDYALLSLCKTAIDKFCAAYNIHEVLYCLRDHRNEPGVSPNCHSILLKRITHQNQDYRLNPRLKKGCRKEIHQFCYDIVDKSSPDELLDGKVIACLKKQYLLNTLTQNCEVEIVNIIREVSANIELDPILYRKCQKEISAKCSNELNMHECLKSKFIGKKIEDLACKHEIARIIRESEADIESDPHLFNICHQDLKTFCGDVVPGKGQQLNCLAVLHRNSPRKLSPECDTLLTTRIELFQYAAEVYPSDSMSQVIQLVANSPGHNYFFIAILTVLLFVFFFGILFGRFSGYSRLSDKDK